MYMTETIHPYSQSATVIQINNGIALLKLESGKEIEWPTELLPSDIKQGHWLTVSR